MAEIGQGRAAPYGLKWVPLLTVMPRTSPPLPLPLGQDHAWRL